MKICIVGAGAVGGLLGVKLLHSGNDVSFVDLPEVVSQIKQQGLSLSNIDGTTQEVSRPTISSEFFSDLPVDLVIMAVKAHQIEHLASKLQTILTPATAVMTIRARGFMPCALAYSGETTSTADAPSTTPDELPP